MGVVYGYDPCFIPIDENAGIYAIAYGKGSYERDYTSYLHTIQLDSSGRFSNEIDSLSFEQLNLATDLLQIHETMYLVAFANEGSGTQPTTGEISSVEIISSGYISDHVLNTYHFATEVGSPCLLMLSDGKAAVCFAGTDNVNSNLLTVDVDYTSEVKTIISKAGSYSLVTDYLHLIGKIILIEDDEEIEHSVMSEPILKDQWYEKVKFTFEENDCLTLAVENVEYEANLPSGTLKKTSSPLTFGFYFGSLNDVEISSTTQEGGETT
jgi:hypothetical protein